MNVAFRMAASSCSIDGGVGVSCLGAAPDKSTSFTWPDFCFFAIAAAMVAELHAINASAAEAMRAALQRYWPAFVYSRAHGGVAFQMLLLELAARKTAFFKVWPPATANSARTFWSPNRGSFRLEGAKKVGPSYGAGAEPH